MLTELSPGLRERLGSVQLSPSSIFESDRGAWEVWLLLRDRRGPRPPRSAYGNHADCMG